MLSLQPLVRILFMHYVQDANTLKDFNKSFFNLYTAPI